MKMKLAISGAAIAALALAGCSSDSDDAEDTTPSAEETMEEAAEAGTIVDLAAGSEDFETLVAAVTAADLVDTLNSDGPFTVFAPTDEAFEAVGQETLDLLLLPSNQEALAGILTYHVIGDEVTSDEVAPGEVETVNGASVTIAVEDDGTVMVDQATVTKVDILASNGVIHEIDAVLLPPDFDPATLATE